MHRSDDGQVTAVSGPPGTIEYRYDPACQLVEARSPHGTLSRWSYDQAGRLTRENIEGITRTNHYDAAGQLLRTETSDGTRTEYVHDGLGRRLREISNDGSERSYAWSHTGWLSSITDHNPDTDPRRTTLWVDALGELALIQDIPIWWDSATNTSDVVAIGDTPLLRTPGGVTGIGEHWTNPGWRGERDTIPTNPWTANPALTLPTDISITTSGALSIAGLEWMGYRAYDPHTHGFLTTDPLPPTIGAGWAGNPYAFAGNDPVHAIDPSGLSPVTDAQLQAYRDGNNGVFAATGDWISHNWDYLAGSAMITAGSILMTTGIGGPAGIALASAGTNVIIQKATTGTVDWVHTAITGATSTIGGWALSGTLSGAADNAYTYLTNPGPHTLTEFLTTTTEGAATGLFLSAAGTATSRSLTTATSQARSTISNALQAEITPTQKSLEHLDLRPAPPTAPIPYGPVPERPMLLLERLDTTGQKFPNTRGGQTYGNRKRRDTWNFLL